MRGSVACKLLTFAFNVQVWRDSYNIRMMSRRRKFIAVAILALSLALLAWGFWPTQRETKVLPIEPANLTLPTPSSYIPGNILTGKIA